MDIETKNTNELKSSFFKGAKPSESDFADLIVAGINQKDFGITRPSGAPLSIVAENSSQEILDFYPTAKSDVAWKLRMNPNAGGQGSAGFEFATGESQSRLFLQSDGKIGIGTTQPEEAFDLNHNSGSAVRLLIQNQNTGGEGELKLRTGTAKNDYAYGWRVAPGKPDLSPSHMTLILKNYDTGKDWLKIDERGFLGVGEAGSGGIGDFFHIKHGNSDSTRLLVENPQGNAAVRMTAKGNSYEWVALPGSEFHLFRHNTGALLRIAEDGNLGLTKTSPYAGARIHVFTGKEKGGGSSKNDAAILNQTEAGDAFFRAKTAKSDYAWYALNSASGFRLTHFTDVDLSKRKDLIRINGNGALALGEDFDPEDRLHVRSGGDSVRVCVENTSGNAALRMKSTTADFGWYADKAKSLLKLWNYTTDKDLIGITDTGWTGIGTTDPKHLLHLKGTKSGSRLKLENTEKSEKSGAEIILATGKPDGEFRLGIAAEDKPRFFLRDTKKSKDRISISDEGKIGMGTAKPSTELSVIGTVRAAHEDSQSNVMSMSHNGADGYVSLGGKGGMKLKVGDKVGLTLDANGKATVPSLKVNNLKWEISDPEEITKSSSGHKEHPTSYSVAQYVPLISYIGGEFKGSDEYMQIYENDSHNWELKIHSGGSRNLKLVVRFARLNIY